MELRSPVISSTCADCRQFAIQSRRHYTAQSRSSACLRKQSVLANRCTGFSGLTPPAASRRFQRGTSFTATAKVVAASPADTMKVGFVGVGIMGLAMANNLIAAGYDVTVWNRNKDKCKPLQEKGAKVADSAKAVAEQCDVTVAMLADPHAAEVVAIGPDGIVAGMSAGKGYVDVSTVDAGTAQKISKAIKGTGALYLEAPVSGSKQPAEKGQLIFLCGGDKELYEQATPLLKVMGKAQFLLGEVGKGANMKLVVNMMMGSMMTVLAEGLTLAQKAGLEQKDLIEVLSLGVMNAPMYAMKGPPMQEHKYPTAFPLKHAQKDMRLALELAHQNGQELPTAAAANALYEQAKSMDQGDADFSAVLEAVLKQSK